mgnify:CR=1
MSERLQIPSRRSAMRWLAALPLGAVMIVASAQNAIAKAKKVSVRYQPEPNGDRKCSDCRHFIKPDACKLVEGEISPNGWCALWAKARK